MRRMADGIRQDFKAAGWETGEPVKEEEAEQLEMAVRGEAGRYVIVAHRSVMVLDRPRFELVDIASETVIWVRGIPTPQRAAELLAEYGVPAAEADTSDPASAPFPPLVPEDEDQNS